MKYQVVILQRCICISLWDTNLFKIPLNMKRGEYSMKRLDVDLSLSKADYSSEKGNLLKSKWPMVDQSNAFVQTNL